MVTIEIYGQIPPKGGIPSKGGNCRLETFVSLVDEYCVCEQENVERVAVITLRPTTSARPEPRKKVVWTEDTVDNEGMNKKKSKCCCVYVKPRKFGESDSESSDSECEHCFGHVEKKKKATRHHHRALTITDTEQAPTGEATATITLQPPSAAEPSPAAPDRPRPAS